MRKLLLLTITSMLSAGVWALPAPKDSCQISDLQTRYARLYAAGSTCGKDENSPYANKLSQLFQSDQENCKVSANQIDPTDKQVDQAFNELDQMTHAQIKELCASLDKQIQAIKQKPPLLPLP
ncbi:hypothetical protein BJD20_12795 [Acinetobacter proteolyticus]|uniref:hypothetical protein n=1 Tax=Acinetobacter proteolyticus TaxID=1776741 RepID=UPI0008632CDE|nr:hypothetical protein [Acinetobacter proteolyticus]OEY95981.1 hypothetical protein BJD20_12795 [Acinetobacter proteolyticus]